MSLESFSEKLERHPLYIFTQRHKKVINVIQGIFIIGLLIGMNIYVVKDHFIKKQIAEKCGYTTSRYKCVCEKNYVEEWEQLEKNNLTGINNWSYENVPG